MPPERCNQRTVSCSVSKCVTYLSNKPSFLTVWTVVDVGNGLPWTGSSPDSASTTYDIDAPRTAYTSSFVIGRHVSNGDDGNEDAVVVFDVRSTSVVDDSCVRVHCASETRRRCNRAKLVYIGIHNITMITTNPTLIVSQCRAFLPRRRRPPWTSVSS